MKFSKWCLAGSVAVLFGCSGVSAADKAGGAEEKLPLYEYGIVGLAARFPHYTGSDEYQTYVFPLPYFIYRGEVLRADRDGVRGIFWQTEKLEMDISLSGNPPAGDNKAREGMDDLDGLGEIGPALNYYFHEYGERDAFYFQATVRAAFSFDFDDGLSIGHEGYVSDLTLVYKNSQLFKEDKFRFHLSTGIRFADAEMHRYFYQVNAADVIPGRELYEAEGGYGGWQLSGSITRDLTPSLAVSCYGRWVNIEGAVFQDSPLVDADNNYFLGAMLVWKVGESAGLEP